MAAYDWSLLYCGVVIMASYGLCSACVNADGQFAGDCWFVAGQAENVVKQFRLRADRVQNCVDIPVCQKIGADDTLIASVIVENYLLDHMFIQSGFHSDYYWAVGIDNGAVGYFYFTTYWELERLLVEGAFD
uniref:Uncharacterized protein n=1 Tax=Romanomermis culicivorax TaxID=13658 RepID=A0A915JUE2_ROMCU